MFQDSEEAMPGGSAVSGIRDPDEECLAWVAEGLCNKGSGGPWKGRPLLLSFSVDISLEISLFKKYSFI